MTAGPVRVLVADDSMTLRTALCTLLAEDPRLSIHVHLHRDRCTLSADTSGDSLHKRGWRQFQGRAPLAETLAAAIVLQSGWDRRSPLLDPFCGSGTVLIEAALLAGGVAPGTFRKRFGFERWPGHDAERWHASVAEARAQVRFPPKLVLIGSDADPKSVDGARENLRSAGLEERIRIDVGDVDAFRPRLGWNAWIVTNPPYGERVGREADLAPIYRRFGAILRERCAGYHVAVLSGNPVLAREIGLEPERRMRMKNGALECELLDRHRFQTQAEARMAIFEFIEGWYNPHRRHSALDYQSPINYERSQLPLN